MSDIIKAANLLRQAGHISEDVFSNIVNNAGATAQGAVNIGIGRSIGQTGNDLIGQYRPQTIEDVQRDEQMRREAEGFNYDINSKVAQRNLLNNMALNEQQNRAQAANNILNAYQNARAANQQFIAGLSGTIGRY
jgi:hypothetical protein